MLNNSLTTVEICKRSITVASNKIIKNKNINIFNKTINFNYDVLDANDRIDFSYSKEIKKELKNIFEELECYLSFEELKNITLIVPSSSYKKMNFTIKKEISFDLTKNEIEIDEIIERMKLDIFKKYESNSEFYVTTLKFKKITIDTEEWVKGTNQIGKNVNFLVIVETIWKEIQASHANVLKSIGKNIKNTVTNLVALHNLDDHSNDFKNKSIIINWTMNEIEVGFFENNYLKLSKKIEKIGLANIISQTAALLKIDENLCKKYIFESLNLNSQNILSSCVLSINKNDKKAKFKGKDFKNALLKAINKNLNEIMDILSFNLKIDLSSLSIYHYGAIIKIPNIEKIYKNSKYKLNFFKQLNIIGALNDYMLSASIGAMNLAESVFKKEVAIEKQIKEKQSANLQLEFSTLFVKNGLSQALFLKQDGIIIDSK